MSVVKCVCRVAIWFAMLLVTTAGFAQGTGGLLPDPISSNEFEGYLAELDADDAQRSEFFWLHAHYLEQSFGLRSGEIETFLATDREVLLADIPFQIPGAKVLKDWLRDYQRLQGQIENREGALFTAMSDHLREDQLTSLDHVRVRRDLFRLIDTSLATDWLGGIGVPGLRRPLAETALDDETRSTALVLLIAYERQLAGRLSGLADDCVDAANDYVRRTSVLRIPASSRLTPREPDEVALIWSVYQESYGGVRERGGEIVRGHLAAVRRIAAVMPLDAAHQFRRLSLSRGQFSLGTSFASISFFSPEVQFKHALEELDLTDAERQEISTQQQAYLTRHRSLVDDFAAMQVERNVGRRNRVWSNDDMDRMNGFIEPLGELNEQTMALDKSAAAALHGILGPERTKAVETAHDRDRTRRRADRMADYPDAASDGLAEGMMWGSLKFVPQAVVAEELDLYLKTLGIGSDTIPVATSLFETYLEQMRAIRRSELADVINKPIEIDYDFEKEDYIYPTRAGIADATAARRLLLARVAEADATLISDLVTLSGRSTSDVVCAGVRLARRYALYARFGERTRIARRGQWVETRGNPMEAILMAPIGEADRLAVLALAVEEAEEATAALEQLRAADRDQDGSYWLNVVVGKEMTDQGMSAEQIRNRDSQATKGAAVARLRNAHRRLITINRSILERAAERVGEDAAFHINAAYRRSAFPELYTDPTSQHAAFDRAIATIDPDAANMPDLLDLYYRYTVGYEAIATRMIDLYSNNDHFGVGDWHEDAVQTTRNYNAMVFQRSEFNASFKRERESIVSSRRSAG